MTRPIRKLGELPAVGDLPPLGKAMTGEMPSAPGPATVPCPQCGTHATVQGGMHCSGRREDGSRWTGGVDWLECRRCSQWFKQVRSPFIPFVGWEPCEPPEYL
jgi:hypothetical protein